MIVYDHSLYQFELIENGKILLFTWKETTAGMTGEDFQEALHNYAGFGAEHKVPAMLVDVRQFRYQMTPELGKWRDEVISPRYASFGLQKFGYIVPEGVLAQMKDMMAPADRAFEEQYFESKDAVIAWLTA